MYPLILTHEERKAIDWIGNRYATGEEFKELLFNHEVEWSSNTLDNSYPWQEHYDITFNIPEHAAWRICELFEEEDFTFPCFSEEFKSKLLEWYWRIV